MSFHERLSQEAPNGITKCQNEIDILQQLQLSLSKYQLLKKMGEKIITFMHVLFNTIINPQASHQMDQTLHRLYLTFLGQITTSQTLTILEALQFRPC